MNFHLSTKYQSRLAIPGDYVLLLINKITDQKKCYEQSFLGFPKMQEEHFVRIFRFANAVLVFASPEPCLPPAVLCFLKFHQYRDGRYLVIGKQYCEDIIIQEKMIIRADIKELPYIPEDENAKILYCFAPSDIMTRSLKGNVGKIPQSNCKGEPSVLRLIENRQSNTAFKFIVLFLVILPISIALLAIQLKKPEPVIELLEVEKIEYSQSLEILAVMEKLLHLLPAKIRVDAIGASENRIELVLQGDIQLASIIEFAENFSLGDDFVSDLLRQAFGSSEGILRIANSYLAIPPFVPEGLDGQGIGSELEVLVGSIESIQKQIGNEPAISFDGRILRASFTGLPEKLGLVLQGIRSFALSGFTLRKVGLNQEGLQQLMLSLSLPVLNTYSASNSPLDMPLVTTVSNDHDSILIQRSNEIIRELFNILRVSPAPSIRVIESDSINNSIFFTGTVRLEKEEHFCYTDKERQFSFCLKPGEEYRNLQVSKDGLLVSRRNDRRR